MKKVVLVGLPLVGQRFDPFGSIPAMPTSLPPLAAWLRESALDVRVIDGFGERPGRRFSPAPGLVARGLTAAEIVDHVPPGADLVGVSVHSVAGDTVARETVAALRERLGVPVVVGGAHPGLMPDRFLEAGATWVVRGEGEAGLALVLDGAAPGLVEPGTVPDLDDLPLPDFEALPLQTYWDLGLGHGPVKGRHLDISTSRGCSQGCRFCATPSLSRGRWRGMSPARVVELMDRQVKRLGVSELHVEDDDFAADTDRVKRICELVLRRGLRVRLALPSGVRAAGLDVETVRLLAAAGCAYLSLAPESGSPRVLRAMRKDVDLDHLRTIAAEAVRSGMRVGCFVVVGFPGEGPEDRRCTGELVDALVRAGVDDVSVFIWSPLPGAGAFGLERGYERLEQLCWTPRWRSGYGRYEGARLGLYSRVLSAMFRSRPLALARSAARVLAGEHETKAEMTLSRMLRWRG
jgi:radical SAM superfamily enzyme YgiQ (UPF0313 family)